MRTVFLFLLLLTAVSAHAQSTRLPQRKSSGTSAPARTSNVAPAPTTRTAARAEERPTSTKLPENRSVQAQQPAPRPGVRQAPAPRRRNSYNGGLAYNKGDNLLQVGVGLSSYYYGNPFGVTYEHGVSDEISVGAQVDYNASSYNGYYSSYYSRYYNYGYSATYFGLRGSYHVNKLLGINSSKFDLYAGLGLGYISFRWNDDDYRGDVGYNSRVFLNYFIGAKYYFSPHFGAFGELGYTGLSSTRIGLAVKF